MSYWVRMLPKKGLTPKGYQEYTVYPLEGVWDLKEEGSKLYLEGTEIINVKDYMVFDIMIRQPSFVTKELLEEYKETAYKKKKNPKILEIELVEYEEVLVCQMMHMGSYDSESESFKRMEDYTNQKGYRRLYKTHREIYLSDPRKVEPDKLKTVLRFTIGK